MYLYMFCAYYFFQLPFPIGWLFIWQMLWNLQALWWLLSLLSLQAWQWAKAPPTVLSMMELSGLDGETDMNPESPSQLL